MSPSRPFFASPSGELNTEQLIDEALPLARLIGAIGVVALIPILLQFFLLEIIGLLPQLGILLSVAVQFILAVGTGIVLMYVIIRSNQLMDE
ncbi:MAG: hypothetical protein ACI8VE_001270 [Natrialbaceae archaeon]|jgi:hypothetical protein